MCPEGDRIARADHDHYAKSRRLVILEFFACQLFLSSGRCKLGRLLPLMAVGYVDIEILAKGMLLYSN